MLLFFEPIFGVLLLIGEPELKMKDVGVDAPAVVDLSEVGVGVDGLVLLYVDLSEVGVDGQDVAVAYDNGGAAAGDDDDARYFSFVDGVYRIAGQDVHVDSVVADFY